jgi:hypothetical protein
MKVPGCKDQLLFEEKVPVTYLILEECINYILNTLRIQLRIPVLSTLENLNTRYLLLVDQDGQRQEALDKLRFWSDAEIHAVSTRLWRRRSLQ